MHGRPWLTTINTSLLNTGHCVDSLCITLTLDALVGADARQQALYSQLVPVTAELPHTTPGLSS